MLSTSAGPWSAKRWYLHLQNSCHRTLVLADLLRSTNDQTLNGSHHEQLADDLQSTGQHLPPPAFSA